MPLILTSNEVIAGDDYDWEDVTGVQYHYPNGYRNLIRPGERFIYYRGVRRAGKKRGCGQGQHEEESPGRFEHRSLVETWRRFGAAGPAGEMPERYKVRRIWITKRLRVGVNPEGWGCGNVIAAEFQP